MTTFPETKWPADLRNSVKISALFHGRVEVSFRVRKSVKISVLFHGNFVFREIPRDLTVDYHPLWPI